jgi:hypothetical protein
MTILCANAYDWQGDFYVVIEATVGIVGMDEGDGAVAEANDIFMGGEAALLIRQMVGFAFCKKECTEEGGPPHRYVPAHDQRLHQESLVYC